MDNETRELFLKVFEVLERFELNVNNRFAEMKTEMAEIKTEMAEMKTEMAGLKNEQTKTNERLDALSSLYGFHEVAIQRLKQKMIL